MAPRAPAPSPYPLPRGEGAFSATAAPACGVNFRRRPPLRPQTRHTAAWDGVGTFSPPADLSPATQLAISASASAGRRHAGHAGRHDGIASATPSSHPATIRSKADFRVCGRAGLVRPGGRALPHLRRPRQSMRTATPWMDRTAGQDRPCHTLLLVGALPGGKPSAGGRRPRRLTCRPRRLT